ncbi:Tyrosine recombinase XerD [uncultured bacterium]|nr:Tyrosine recombinase XerD [uncultured bacterium]
MATQQRLRDYLTRDEVAFLLRAAKKSPRHGVRNHAMILLAYRHGLRASELVNLRVSDLDLSTGTVYCRRAKGSRSSLHPMKPDEIVALQKVLQQRKVQANDCVFQSERSEKMSRSAFWRIVSSAGDRAGLPVKAYAHQLRHACGYYLANKGCDLRLIQDYLGHNQIQNTVRYTVLNAARFAGLW